MKKNLFLLQFLWSITSSLALNCMELTPTQEEQRALKKESEQQNAVLSYVPTLIELAAQKAGQTIAIDSEQFNKLARESQDQIITQFGTWQQLFAFVKKYPIDVSDQLLDKITQKLIQELLENKIILQDFMNMFNSLPSNIQQRLTIHFKDKIEEFFNRPQTLVNLKIISRDNIDRPTGYVTKVLPADFKAFSPDIPDAIISNINIIDNPDYLIALFLAQKIENFIIYRLLQKFNSSQLISYVNEPDIKEVPRKSELVDKKYAEQVLVLLHQIEVFIKPLKKQHPIFTKFLKTIETILISIMKKEVVEIEIELFEFDQQKNAYILKK